jgi:hypothetical protein
MPTSIVQRCRVGREAYGSRHLQEVGGLPCSVRPDHQLVPTDVQMHGENAQPLRVLRHDFCDIVIETRAFSRAGSGSMSTRSSRTSEMEMAA